MNLDRLRRLTRRELAWRAGCAARQAAERVAVRIRPPRWDRRDLGRILAADAAAGPVREAIGAQHWNDAHDALATVMRRRPARFVLDPRSAAPLRAAIVERWPSAPARAAERADAILKGQYDLLGYRGLSFDTRTAAVDWHCDPVHNRRAPLSYWADVPYLDRAVGDHKIIWELNRHQHWLQLGRACWLTGDPRYGLRIVNLLDSWLAANPPLIGINWSSMLEIGFRAMSWTWALHFLIAGAEGPAAVPWLVDLLVALDRQMTHLEQNLSYYFSPNTHLTGEALALYVVGAALPELGGSGRWMQTGRQILLDEIARQVHADGGHAERSTHYQRYTLDFYLLAWLTAQRIGDTAAAQRFSDAVSRLAEFTRTVADDAGRLPLIGDDDGGMLWPIAGRACHDVRDSLALAALLTGRPGLAPWGVTEEVLWLAGPKAIDASPADARPATAVPALPSRTFEQTGWVVLRDERGAHAVFDAGPHGYLNGGHAHADALALTLSLDGRPLLVDPGTSTYTMDARLRDRLRSSISHNTITIGHRSQAIPSGPFHWHTRADAALHASRHNGSFDWAEGVHDGYAPVTHRRAVMRTARSGWLIVDRIAGYGRHSADAYWHFDPAWMVTCDAPGRLRAAHFERGRAWLLHDEADICLMHGDEDTGLGWCAPVYGTLVPTWTARLTRHGVTPITMVTWIGLADDGRPPVLERFTPQSDGRARAVGARIHAATGTSTFALLVDEPVSRDGRACGTPEFQTDARVLHYIEQHDRLAVLDLVDASHALAVRDGWISVTASEPLAELHLAIEGDVLQVQSVGLRGDVRIEGDGLRGIQTVRMNGRDVGQPTSVSTTPSQVIVRARSNPASPSAAASVLFSANC